ncbi:hypothetical protein C8035_v008808 [Colletotrichum spinosum]|uniref:Uncharacterized protein n=1 Tax=Colletotrichum spinosum TaxID=1347390 RepID=A0A4R8QMI1_9PEZI|nr:hypothetical protein C8035_v008808 [Colletotrichum spinosum]
MRKKECINGGRKLVLDKRTLQLPLGLIRTSLNSSRPPSTPAPHEAILKPVLSTIHHHHDYERAPPLS